MNEIKENSIGVFIGRLSPIHLGHQKIIEKMITNHGNENSIIFIGSCNSPLSIRVPFSYRDRSRWVRRIFKDIRIIGMPDVDIGDIAWLEMLDDYISAVFPGKTPYFYGGSIEDVKFFYEHGNRKVIICDRQELAISATNVRKLILLGESIETIVDTRISKEVVEVFNKAMKRLDVL